MLDVRDRTSRTGEEQRPEPRCGKAYWPVQDSSFSSWCEVTPGFSYCTSACGPLCLSLGKQAVRGHRDGREGTREGLGRRHAIDTEVLT